MSIERRREDSRGEKTVKWRGVRRVAMGVTWADRLWNEERYGRGGRAVECAGEEDRDSYSVDGLLCCSDECWCVPQHGRGGCGYWQHVIVLS
jgi:hypothetical protein